MVGSGLEWAALTASLECSGCTWKERKGGKGRGKQGELMASPSHTGPLRKEFLALIAV